MSLLNASPFKRSSVLSTALASLPLPSARQLIQSQSLQQMICEDIRKQGGRISFAAYMEKVLYTPGLGYYSSPSEKFGKAGDFITAPELTPLFSQCLASQCAEVLMTLGE